MSHIPRVTGDPATAAEIVLRRARKAVIIFKFLVNGTQIPIEDDFALRVKQNDKSEDNLLELDFESGLEINGLDLRAIFTEENSAIDQYKCVYELINLTSGQSWIASKIYFNTGEPIQGTTSEVSSTINTGDQIIECNITIASSGGSDISSTDELPEGSTNLYFTVARVLATLLTGLSILTGGSIEATDTILQAFGKIQKQINDALTLISGKQDALGYTPENVANKASSISVSATEYPNNNAVIEYAVPLTRQINGVALSSNRSIPSRNFIKRTGKFISNAVTQENFVTPQAVAANTLRAWPIDISTLTTLIRVAVEVTTLASGTSCRVAMYADDGNNYPGALVANHEADGTIDSASTGVKTKNLTGGVISNPGRYWIAINSNGAPTFRSLSRYAMSAEMGFAATLGTAVQPLGWTAALAYGAMPATFPAGGTVMNITCPAMGWEEA